MTELLTAELEKRALPMTPADRRAAGKRLRDRVPRDAHAGWRARSGARTPSASCAPPMRPDSRNWCRSAMAACCSRPSPSTAAPPRVMAADLAATPATGIHVQACGDCHLMNFGGFATPERRMIFDINDFDETLPAPWEWDVKRLVASFVLAARVQRAVATRTAAMRRLLAPQLSRTMRDFAEMNPLDVWYARIDDRRLLAMLPEKVRRRALGEADRQGDSGQQFGTGLPQARRDGRRATPHPRQPAADLSSRGVAARRLHGLLHEALAHISGDAGRGPARAARPLSPRRRGDQGRRHRQRRDMCMWC